MRRFEFVEGTSSKFWEVWCEGSSLKTRYGKIGASGQTTIKSFGDEAAARKAEEALIRQKTGKGYVEKGGAAPAAAVDEEPPRKTALKLTPFLKRLQSDPKLKKALLDSELAPAEEEADLAAWAQVEAAQHESKFMRFSDERLPLDFLADFPETEVLELAIDAKTKLEPLRALTKLKVLKLTGTLKGFVDLSFVSGMKALQELDIRGPPVKSLAPLASASSLMKLGISHGAVDDLTPLSKLKSFKQLFLPGHKLTTLAPLAAMTTLTYIQVPQNQITDVSPLAKSKSLRFVGLKQNQVRDVSALSGLMEVDTMYLEGNPAVDGDTSSLRGLKKLKTKDFKIKVGKGAVAPKVSDALRARLEVLAATKDCRALLEKLLGKLNDVSEKKGLASLKFDADDNDVIVLEVASPFSGRLATDLPASFVEVVTKVGASVHVDVSRPGVDGPFVGVTKKGAPACDVAWEDEDRSRFHDFCNAGQNWFVWDTAKKNKLGEPGIVFFSHEGALDPKRRFPMQDKLAFGVGGFVLRALAFRVFSNDKAYRGCGWG
ncbi:MAG: WGR domain-containing protein [Archangium sp.]|nr:WGR domain-containing protein [Archangium sp.]